MLHNVLANTSRGAPVYDSVQMVNITPITMFYGTQITIMGFINQFMTFGGPTWQTVHAHAGRWKPRRIGPSTRPARRANAAPLRPGLQRENLFGEF
jgi:hypothetical protein